MLRFTLAAPLLLAACAEQPTVSTDYTGDGVRVHQSIVYRGADETLPEVQNEAAAQCARGGKAPEYVMTQIVAPFAQHYFRCV